MVFWEKNREFLFILINLLRKKLGSINYRFFKIFAQKISSRRNLGNSLKNKEINAIPQTTGAGCIF